MKVKVNYVALSQIFPARTIEPRRRGLELVAGSWELWEIGGCYGKLIESTHVSRRQPAHPS